MLRVGGFRPSGGDGAVGTEVAGEGDALGDKREAREGKGGREGEGSAHGSPHGWGVWEV